MNDRVSIRAADRIVNMVVGVAFVIAISACVLSVFVEKCGHAIEGVGRAARCEAPR